MIFSIQVVVCGCCEKLCHWFCLGNMSCTFTPLQPKDQTDRNISVYIVVAKKKFRRQQQSSLSCRLCNEDKWATKMTIRTWSFISYCSKEPSLCCLHICLCFLILKIIVLWSRKLILGVNHTKYDHITLVLHCSSTLTTPITSSDFFCISTQRWVCCTIATQTLNGLSHSKPTHLATPFW